MDVARAQHIFRSERLFRVELDGMPVWIDRIDAENELAQVHKETAPDVSQLVELSKLREVQE